MEAAMSHTSIPIHSPAPAPDGPVACTLSPNQYAGRLDDFRQGVFRHLTELERPEPTRLLLTLDVGFDPEAVAELLVREQGCCAFTGRFHKELVRMRGLEDEAHAHTSSHGRAAGP
jgi:hypothetical protein